MMSLNVVIRYDNGYLELYLPNYFNEMPLSKIRKIFELLKTHSYQNDAAFEILNQFFPEWERNIKNQLDSSDVELIAAKRDAEEKRRVVASLGAAPDDHIAQAKNMLTEGKKWLAHARKRRKPKAAEINEAKEAIKKIEAVLANAMRSKTDYQQAVKKVKRLEMTIKQTKAALERCGKIINAYTQILR